MKIQDKLLNIYKKHGALTDPELAKLAGLPENSARPCRIKLEELGLICRTDKVKSTKGKIVTCANKRKVGYHRLYKIATKEPTTDEVWRALHTITRFIESLEHPE